MTNTTVYTFKPDKSAGIGFSKMMSLIAFVLGPTYLFFVEDVRNIYFLIGFALFVASLPFVMRGLRFFVGGVEGLMISAENIELIKRKDNETIAWSDMAKVEFERVNDLPWILLVTNEKEKHRICLEDFTEEDRNQIHELIAGEAWGITEEKTTWVVGNRLSFSYKNKKEEPLVGGEEKGAEGKK